MPAHAMNHFTILTKDVAATQDFYSDILGLKVGYRPPITRPGASSSRRAQQRCQPMQRVFRKQRFHGGPFIRTQWPEPLAKGDDGIDAFDPLILLPGTARCLSHQRADWLRHVAAGISGLALCV